MSNNENNKKSLKDEATRLYEQLDYRGAVDALRAVLHRDPNDYVALFYLGLNLYEIGHFQRSLQCWKRLKKMGARQKNIHLNLGCVYQATGRNDLAIRNYRKELELNPTSGEALYNLGTLYYNAHKYKKAINYLERCYWLGHSVDQVVDRLAYSYFKTQQSKNEITLYQDFLQTHPDDIWCLNNLGAVLMQIGEYNRAQIYLQKGASLAPQDSQIQKNLEKTRLLRKRGAEARVELHGP